MLEGPASGPFVAIRRVRRWLSEMSELALDVDPFWSDGTRFVILEGPEQKLFGRESVYHFPLKVDGGQLLGRPQGLPRYLWLVEPAADDLVVDDFLLVEVALKLFGVGLAIAEKPIACHHAAAVYGKRQGQVC